MRCGLVHGDKRTVSALQDRFEAGTSLDLAFAAMTPSGAIAQIESSSVDLILVDLALPDVDVHQITQRAAERRCAVCLLTESNPDLARLSRALSRGAADSVAVWLDPDGALHGWEQLLERLSLFESVLGLKRRAGLQKPVPTEPPLLLIGASTGGPGAVAKVLSILPSDFSGAVIVVQHVDQQFASGMSDWLSKSSGFPVRIAKAGDQPTAGVAILASSNDHLIMKAGHVLGYTSEPKDNPCRPSVDVFFLSVARHWDRPGVAVILTGIGKDGAEGLLALRKKGWHTIAQDQTTSVIYGMPRAAAECGAAIEVLSLDGAAQSILHHMSLLLKRVRLR